MVGQGPFDAANCSTAPADLQNRRGVRAYRYWNGENPEGLVAREIPSAGHHFLTLGHGWGDQANLGSEARRVGGSPLEFHRDAGRGGLVAMHLNRAIDAIDHQVQIPVLIEVAQGHAEGQAFFAETPLGRLWLEGAITPVAEGQVGRAPLGIQFHPSLPLFWGEGAAGVLHPVLGIRIHQVIFEAIGNQQVFVAIEVDIQKDGAPTPITGREAGTEGCLDIAPSGSSEEEHVPIELGPTC